MLITLVKAADTTAPYVVSVHLSDNIRNRVARVEQATLVCSCGDFRSEQTCSHTSAAENTSFKKWRKFQLSSLRRDVLGGQNTLETPVDVIANTFTEELGVNLKMAKIILLPDGSVALQHDVENIPARYSLSCGWGTGGQQVAFLPADTNQAAIFHLLVNDSRGMEYETWCYEMDTMVYVNPMPALPRMISCSPGNFDERDGSIGHGLLDFIESPEKEYSGREDEWARWWASVVGLTLDGEGWQNVGRYLPDSMLNGQPVGGLALDLTAQKVKGITADGLSKYSEGIPEYYKNKIAHTHLAWEPSSEANVGNQVIIRHPNLSRLQRDDAIMVLTTNLWEETSGVHNWAEEIEEIMYYAAGYMLRLGHSPDATLFHGEYGEKLGRLAEFVPQGEATGEWHRLRDLVTAVEMGVYNPADFSDLDGCMLPPG